MNAPNQSLMLKLALVAVIVAAINLIAAPLAWRLDLTEENLYTLSEGTEQIAKNLKRPVTFKLYFSESAPGVPLQYKSYGQRVEEVLREYERLNPEMIHLEVFDPKPDSDEELWAVKYGLKGADLGDGTRFFLGLVGTSEDQEQALAFFDPRAESSLEYDLSELLLGLQSDQGPKLGLISSLPVLGSQPDSMARLSGAQPKGPWALFGELARNFELLEIQAGAPIPEDLSLLLVIHPKAFSEEALYRLEQYLFSGGKALVFVDPHARSDQAGQAMAQMGQRGQAASDLAKLFDAWGIEYDSSRILGDLDRAAQVNAGGTAIPFALWHELGSSAMNGELVPTKGLEQMLLIEPGALRLREGSALKLEPLISSSNRAGLLDSALLAYMPPMQINQELKPDGEPWFLAALLSGEVESAFAQPPELSQGPTGEHKTHGALNLAVVADVDLLYDRFAVDAFNLLGQTIVQPKNDNLGFFLNLNEYLSGADELMSIRSRGRFSRPFERFEELSRAASEQYREAERELNEELRQVQAQLAELDRGNQGAELGQAQLEQIQKFREKESATKLELREIRKLLRQDIEQEITFLTLVNLLVVPAALVLFGLWVYRRRFKSSL